jgi:UDP-glucose 4-epimerase
VLVTGASGFLGRHLARLLARRGHVVAGIGHGEWPREDWVAWGLSAWHCGDVTMATLERHAGSPSAVFHCAGGGSVAFANDAPLLDFKSTVETTAVVLEYVRTMPGCRIVYPSSASVYGTVQKMPISESCPAAPISQYGVHKLMAEHLVSQYAREFATPAAIVRLFSVYGCGLKKQLLWDACRKLSRDHSVFMGTGDEVRDWLHVEDAAELMVIAAEKASADCPVVNGGRGTGITVREVLNYLGSCLGSAIAPEFSGAQRTGDPSRFVAEIERATRWGWNPKRDWKQGVQEYAAWYSGTQL